MCWEIDNFERFAEQRRVQEGRINRERRTGIIDRLVGEANRQAERTVVERPEANFLS